MWSRMRMRTTVLLATAALLCSVPAAARTKPNTTRVKARTAVTASRTRASSRKPARPAAKVQSASTRRGTRRKSQNFVKVVKTKFRGQQSIDQARTMQIQQALIREHYLDGEATGEWNQTTRDALIRFQGDNHWQTKVLPDARALIKLGLGPSQQNLLNPESAAIASPYQSGLEKSSPGGSN